MARDIAMEPANILIHPKEERYQDHFRRWQGCPKVEVTKRGKLFVSIYTGGAEEDSEIAQFHQPTGLFGLYR